MKNPLTQADQEEEKRGYAQTAATATALLEFEETKTWVKDIESVYKDNGGNVRSNAYLIIQLLEK
jgi:hypothetical protein